MRNTASLGGVLVMLVTACQSAKETPQQMQARMEQETTAFKQAISGITRRWEGWIAAGQADSIAAAFTEQGREMPPNEPAVVGRAAIRDYEARNATMFAQKLAIQSEAAMASGPLGVERGHYTFEGKAKKGAPKGVPAHVSDEGKYLIHWHSVNGQWEIADLIWNANKGMMMPSAAPASHPKPAKKHT